VRPAQEARAVDDLSEAADDRRQERRVVGRVVLEVGVLDEQDVAGGEGETATPSARVAGCQASSAAQVPSREQSSTATISSPATAPGSGAAATRSRSFATVAASL
jgi:predicted carbohydrate-binding protein with CBM5 and CBM33 domain